MSANVLAKRYANALLQLADDAGVVERVSKDIADVAAMWASSEPLRQVFANPKFSVEVRRNLARELATAAGAHKLVLDTLLLLTDRQRIRYLPEIAAAFAELAETRTGTIRAEVISASELPASYSDEVKKALESVTGKKVVVVRRTDPSLIGGVVTRVGDRVFDGSIRNRLAELKTELLAE